MSKALESPNIRISPQSKAVLRELADQEGKPMQTVLDDAVEQYRRDKFFKELDEGFGRLQANPLSWKEEVEERQLWDSTLGDGLEDSRLDKE